MKNTKVQLFIMLFFAHITFSQIGIFEKGEDIGNPKMKGSSAYDEASQSYTLKGGGENIWFNHDEFHFLYKKIKGDFILTGNFELIGNDNGNGHRKTGWMIRESNQHDAISINSCLHGDGLAVLQWRLMRGAYMRDPEEEIFFPRPYFGETIIELERIGKQITMRLAKPGEPFESMGSITLPDLKDEVLIGPYALAHAANDIQEARVWNVRLSVPVAANWHANRLVKTGSHEGLITATKLETVELATGIKTILAQGDTQIKDQTYSADYKYVTYLKNGTAQHIPVGYGTTDTQAKKVKKASEATAGNYIYYSAYKNGSNQIWRKRSDGSGAEQLTWEINHSRAPQLSPDGKHLAYLVYPHVSNPGAEVAFQKVYLKVLPLAGGAPKTVAYIYGGKDSLGPNCWSGDSKHILFTSR